MHFSAFGLQAAQGSPTARARCADVSVDIHPIHSRAHRRDIATRAATTDVRSAAPIDLSSDPNQQSREGSYEAPLVKLQASKSDPDQATIASILPPVDTSITYDVGVVGCGPAGLALAAELASRGLSVALVGHDTPFVNNYGVWLDEFQDLGLEKTLDHVWKDAMCYFKEGKEVRVGRAYGRVCRRALRAELLSRCATAGVNFLGGEVGSVAHNGVKGTSEGSEAWQATGLTLQDGQQVKCRMATLASGAAAGRFLEYERTAPSVAAQTAYGIEAEVEGYGNAYDLKAMLFMDYRRHHSGLYPKTAMRQKVGQHQNGGAGLWGTENETPSFLYAMPLGGNRVFLEETCLVAKPALPFAVLKRRLQRRCEALGIKIKEIHEEEWSYIPTGGPLPIPGQTLTAFGAAANLVHPATGYSIARSLREAPAMARAITDALQDQPTAEAASRFVWEALWTQERRRQASFHIFGMELLCHLDVKNTSDFFTTFFALPTTYWRGFLASKLSSKDLLAFAMLTFFLAPVNIKAKLVTHLMADPAGKYFVDVYLGKNREEYGISSSDKEVAGAAVVAAVMAATAVPLMVLASNGHLFPV